MYNYIVNFSRRAKIILWQLLFLLLATTWLWAPHLNPALSYRSSLISEYESPHQPYAWAFRLCDALAGVLVILISRHVSARRDKKIYGYLLLAFGIGLVLDPVLPTTCVSIGGVCKEYYSLSYVLHASETILTASAILALSIYDWVRRRRLVSAVLVLFELGYGILFLTQLADHDHFNTASQFIYQTTLIIWTAWFCRSILFEGNFKVNKNEVKIVKNIVGIWAFLNGVLAILVSLAHIHLIGHIRGLYFAGDSAWLAQHGVVVGVIMIYLSRHLVRGEMRARQIFLLITGLETLKYSAVSPNGWLLAVYLITFCVLFVLRDDFDRGVAAATFTVRLKDAIFMLCSLLAVVLIFLVVANGSNERSRITAQSVDNFFDYTLKQDVVSKTHLKSALLAHTESAFVVAGATTILWILFRPYKRTLPDKNKAGEVEHLLRKHSDSSEDYFKLWPHDKSYYFSNNQKGFIVFRETGPVCFALANPIVATSGRQSMINDFLSDNKANRLRTCFLMVQEKNKGLYKNASMELVQIGASAEVDIDKFLNNTAHDKWWRWQKNRAIKSGYLYSVSQPPHSNDFMQHLKTVSNEWLRIDGHEERGFALGYFDEQYMQKCKVHYLHNDQGKVLAFTNQLPQFSNRGITTIDLMRYLPEARGAMPYLLLNTIGQAKIDNYTSFDLGFVPFARAKGPILKIARALSTGRFSAKGLEQFKNKFDPDWQPNYMAYDGDLADLALIAINLERVMNIKP
jgi:lysylphosphatidylglycerol synthetase-like protein (DUF2156 family)